MVLSEESILNNIDKRFRLKEGGVIFPKGTIFKMARRLSWEYDVPLRKIYITEDIIYCLFISSPNPSCFKCGQHIIHFKKRDFMEIMEIINE